MNRYYIERFNKVLEYIYLNLDGTLDIRTLAGVAFISEYHFHRLIKSFLGEPLGAYIKRIRVETGAKLLKYSDSSVTQIAYEIGYKTPTSFNKSFRNYFSVSPGQFRKNPNISLDNVKKIKEKTNFEITITRKKIDDFLILCHPTKGELISGDIKSIWENLISYCKYNNLITNTTKYIGIHWDDPSITEEKKLRFDACISIDKKISCHFPVKKINGGNYLCFTFKGDEKYLGDIYDQIFRDHIVKNNIKLKNQPPFEVYMTRREAPSPRKRITDIYIPVL